MNTALLGDSYRPAVTWSIKRLPQGDMIQRLMAWKEREFQAKLERDAWTIPFPDDWY